MIRNLNGHFDGILNVTITNDGKKIVSSSYDCAIKIWNMITGKAINTLIGN